MASGEGNTVKVVAPEFEMPTEEALRSWWYNIKFFMAEANKANKRYEQAAALLKERRARNGWNDTTYRDICKKDYALNDALDAWKFYSAEVLRFQSAISAAADMKRLLG